MARRWRVGESELRLRPWLWLSALGAAIASAASWFRFASRGTLAIEEATRPLALEVALVVAGLGLVLMGASCVVTFRSAHRHRLEEVLACALVVHALMLLALPLYSTDLFSYLAYGQLAAHGHNPHVVLPEAMTGSPLLALTTWAKTPSVYGPVADLAMALAGHVGVWTGSPVWGAGVAYKLLVAVFDIGSILIVYSMARGSRTIGAPGFVLFALSPMLAWEVAAQCHNDGLIVAFGVLFLWAARRSPYSPWAVVALVLGTLSKFVLLPSLALHARVVARAGLGRAALLGLVAAGVALAAYAPFWTGPETLSTWLRPLGATRGLYHASSMFTVAAKSLGVLHVPASAIEAAYYAYVWVGRLILGGIAVSMFVRVRSTHGVTFASFLVLLAALATTAALAPWYFPWLLPFAAALRDRRWQWFTLAISVGVSPTAAIPYGWLLLPVLQLVTLVALWRWSIAPWLGARLASRRGEAMA